MKRQSIKSAIGKHIAKLEQTIGRVPTAGTFAYFTYGTTITRLIDELIRLRIEEAYAQDVPTFDIVEDTE